MQLYLISALLFSLIVAVFAVQNTETVIVKFLTFQFPISLVLVILGSAVIGALTLYFLSLFSKVSSWMKIRQLNQHKKQLEQQIQELEQKLSGIEEKTAIKDDEANTLSEAPSSDNENSGDDVENTESN